MALFRQINSSPSERAAAAAAAASLRRCVPPCVYRYMSIPTDTFSLARSAFCGSNSSTRYLPSQLASEQTRLIASAAGGPHRSLMTISGSKNVTLPLPPPSLSVLLSYLFLTAIHTGCTRTHIPIHPQQGSRCRFNRVSIWPRLSRRDFNGPARACSASRNSGTCRSTLVRS